MSDSVPFDGGYSLFVDAATIRSAISNTWVPPEHAAVRGTEGEQDYKAAWYQDVQIVDTDVQPGKEDGQIVFLAVFTTPGDGEDRTNIGKRHFQRFWITKAAIKDRKHADHDGTERNFRNLTKLIRACGLDSEGGLDYGAIFSPKDGEKPLVGKVTKCRVSIYMNKNGEPQMSMDNFVKVEE